MLADLPAVREVGGAQQFGVDDDVVEREPRPLLLRGAAQPLVEGRTGDDVARHARLEEGIEGVVGGEQVGAAHPVGDLLALLDGRPVRGDQFVPGLPLPLDQRAADEDLACLDRVVGRVVGAPCRHDRHAEQADLLVGLHRGGAAGPVGLGDGAGQHVTADLFDHLGGDGRDGARPQPRRLDQFEGHHQRRGGLRQRRARLDREPCASRALVLGERATLARLLPGAFLLGEPDVGQQPAEQAGQHLWHGPAAGGVEVEFAGGLLQLGDEVLPLAEPDEAQVFGAAQPAEGAASHLAALGAQVGPDVEQHLEVAALGRPGGLLLTGPGAGVGGVAPRLPAGGFGRRFAAWHPAPEPAVQFVCLLLELGRPLAHVGHGQAGDQDEDGGKRVAAGPLDQHPAELGVDRHPGEHPAGAGQPQLVVALARVDGAQFAEHPDAVVDVGGDGRLDEREGLDVAQARLRHQQDDGCEVGAQDLGVGELGAGLEVLLRVEPDRNAGADAAAAARALVGGGLRHGLDREALHLRPGRVARDAGGARVDHVADPRDGDGGLGDVGGEHDAAGRLRREDALLVGGGQPGEQREHLEAGAERLDGVGRVADLALTAEEHQDVAGRRRRDDLLDRGGDLVDLVLPLVWLAVDDLDGVGAAGHLDDRGVVEVLGEAGGVDRRGGDDHAQVRALGQQLLEVAEQEVDVEASLVRLVDDDRVVAAQHPVVGQFRQQDAVGHHLHPRPGAHLARETHLVADELADLDPALGGDALRDRPRGDPARLGVRDPFPAREQADLGKLRRLARAGLAGHDDDLVVADQLRDVFRLRRDRQGRVDLDGGGLLPRHPCVMNNGHSAWAIRPRSRPPSPKPGIVDSPTPSTSRS